MHRYVSLVQFRDYLVALTEDGTIYRVFIDQFGMVTTERLLKLP